MMLLNIPNWREDLSANTTRRGPLTPIVSWFLDPSFACVILVRLATCRRRNVIDQVVGRLAARFLVRWFGCYVSIDAKIGRRLVLPHPVGIVIGDGSTIGDDVTIYQHVTLGRKSSLAPDYPRILDGAVIYAGAVLIGGITVGSRAMVGANSVVIKDVAESAIVAGVPAKTLRTRPDVASESQ